MQRNKRSRLGALVIGAVVGSVLSVGAATGSVSAKSFSAQVTATDDSAKVVVVADADPVGPSANLMSGIRW
jgi:hypothetical protein